MNKLNQALVGTAAAATMAVSITPAMARDYQQAGNSNGRVVAGVSITVANDGRDYQDTRYHDTDYRDQRYYRDNDRSRYHQLSREQAVKKCAKTAEKQATRRGRAEVTDIHRVTPTRYGYQVTGLVQTGKAHRGNYRDISRFTCAIDGKQVANIRFSSYDYARR